LPRAGARKPPRRQVCAFERGEWLAGGHGAVCAFEQDAVLRVLRYVVFIVWWILGRILGRRVVGRHEDAALGYVEEVKPLGAAESMVRWRIRSRSRIC
jgi:hypothetical protein